MSLFWASEIHNQMNGNCFQRVWNWSKNSRERIKKIVCGFDEFGDVENLDGDRIIKLFRSVIQLQKESSYLFAGSYESVMNRIFNTKSSPFLRFARIIHLGPITPAEFTPFLTKVFVSNQIEKGNSWPKRFFPSPGVIPITRSWLSNKRFC